VFAGDSEAKDCQNQFGLILLTLSCLFVINGFATGKNNNKYK
jgi:hypothetical protein